MPAPETAPATIIVQPTSRLNRIGSIMDTRLSAGVALPVLEFCGDVVTIHAGDEVERDLLDRAAGVDGDVAARLDDLVERTSVDDQVFDDREGARTPRLDADFVPVGEVTHVQLAGGGAADRAVRDAVDHHAARAADA